MGKVIDTEVCPICGEEYQVELDIDELTYTKITMCKCDRFRADVEKFLRERGLWEEFLRFFKKNEEERKDD